MTRTGSTIQFLGDWREEQHGVIERGSILTLDYDDARLPDSFATWRGAEFGDIVALCRFHPRGDVALGSVVAPVRDGDNPPGMVIGHVRQPLELPVPPDATKAEIWFHGFHQTTRRGDSWDSRFGTNYWFDIGGPSPRVPTRPVSYRVGAITQPGIVNVLEHHAAKNNMFGPPPDGGPAQGSNLQTTLDVLAWVFESPYGANAWIDLHVFDEHDEVIEASTRTLSYGGFGSDPLYRLADVVYQGSTATPGSVQPRSDARTLQYRLYYEVNYRVYTDGILHQLQLPQDALLSV